jgi:branched-subunit amino acid transport protein
MILGAAIVTFLPRVLPLVVFSRIQLPDWALRFLSYVPVAVMAALLTQELLTTNNKLVPILHNEKLLAFIPTLLIALITRSLLGTVVAGILSMMALSLFF